MLANFKDWILKYKGKDSIKGDLANDIYSDKDFPDTEDIEKIKSYLEFKLWNNSEGLKELKKLIAQYMKSSGN